MVSLLGIIAGISLILAVIVTGTVVGVCLLVSWLTRGARPGSVAPGRPRRGAHGGGALAAVRTLAASASAAPRVRRRRSSGSSRRPAPGPLPGSAPPWPPQNSPGAPVAPPRAHR